MAIDEIRAGGPHGAGLEANGGGALAPDEAGIIFTHSTRADGQRVLEIRGDLDIAVSGLLGHELDELLELGRGRVAVDLSGVLFMDSSALSALVHARERAKDMHQQLVLVDPSPACVKVLGITGLDRVFDGS